MRARFASAEAEQEAKPLRDDLAHLWLWYCEVSDGRAEGFSGPGAIGYPDIAAWSQLSGTRPSPFEARLILITDRNWRSEYHRLQEIKRPKTGTPDTQPTRKRKS